MHEEKTRGNVTGAVLCINRTMQPNQVMKFTVLNLHGLKFDTYVGKIY